MFPRNQRYPNPPSLHLTLYQRRINSITDLKEFAIQVTTDADHKFQLAPQLDTVLEIARSVPELEGEVTLGDRAFAVRGVSGGWATRVH